jgi:tRNA 2-thiouridine synthesizing protein E
MEKVIAGHPVTVNEEGYLQDLSQWNKDVATAIAEEEEITLGPDHWKVIDYLQDQERQKVALSIRKIGKSGVVSIKEFYALFPDGPLKKASKIAGIKKPASCI